MTSNVDCKEVVLVNFNRAVQILCDIVSQTMTDEQFQAFKSVIYDKQYMLRQENEEIIKFQAEFEALLAIQRDRVIHEIVAETAAFVEFVHVYSQGELDEVEEIEK